jgi:hypothetical protein
VAIGLNIQPFLYLRRPYLHVSPASEKGNLQAVRSAGELKRAFQSLGVTFVAFRPWGPFEQRTYPRREAPQMYAFVDRYARFVRELARTGQLEKIARVGAVRIYRLAPDGTGARPAPGSRPSSTLGTQPRRLAHRR